MTRDATHCHECGYPLPPRIDPRGRPKRYCSDACRAAARRARIAREHAAELATARQQATRTRPDETETIREATRLLRDLAASLWAGNEVMLSPDMAELVAASREITALTSPQIMRTEHLAPPPARPAGNRKQRRAAKRKRRH